MIETETFSGWLHYIIARIEAIFFFGGGHYLLEFMFGIWLNMIGCHEGVQMASIVCITTGGKWTIQDQLFADCITKICSQKKSVSL
jgi:hypothetical protein